MEGSEFDEVAFWQAISASGCRALLIGRRALVALGVPVLTADYDFWLHPDDVESFNAALEPFGLVPTWAPEDARRRGRYALENDEHVDVLLSRVMPTVDGVRLAFDDVWARRTIVGDTAAGVQIPAIDDLITTKRFGSRPKDVEDIRLLEALKREGDAP